MLPLTPVISNARKSLSSIPKCSLSRSSFKKKKKNRSEALVPSATTGNCLYTFCVLGFSYKHYNFEDLSGFLVIRVESFLQIIFHFFFYEEHLEVLWKCSPYPKNFFPTQNLRPALLFFSQTAISCNSFLVLA